MSTLPLISHRLFVAAVRTEGNSPKKPDRNEAAIRNSAPKAAVIPLEILESGKPMPAGMTRRLQATMRATI